MAKVFVGGSSAWEEVGVFLAEHRQKWLEKGVVKDAAQVKLPCTASNILMTSWTGGGDCRSSTFRSNDAGIDGDGAEQICQNDSEGWAINVAEFEDDSKTVMCRFEKIMCCCDERWPAHPGKLSQMLHATQHVFSCGTQLVNNKIECL